MERKGWHLFLFILLLGFLSGAGAGPTLPCRAQVPSQASPPEQYKLRFSPRPRQTLVYNLQTRMESEGQGFLGRNLTLSAQADGEIDVFIRQVSSDGVFTELSSPGIRIFIQNPGRQDEFTLRNPPDSPVLLTFDRAGRITEVKNVEKLEEQNPLNFSILDILRNYWPAFPDKPLSIGESWPDHKRLMVPFQGMDLVIELEIAFTLNAVVPGIDGRQALITAAYTATLSGEREAEGFRGLFEGRGSGSGSLSFQADAGYFSEYRLDYFIDGAMVMQKAGNNVVEWPFRLTAESSLLLLEWR